MNLATEGEPEGYAVAAYLQEQGRGQRGNSWESQNGQNLTFSLLLRPTFLRVEEQFTLSKVIALSVCDWIDSHRVTAKIKWPNDIYAGDRKVAGILIENSFSSPLLEVSVVGIGLNLNQTEFSNGIPNPTSMCQLTGNRFRPEIVLSEIVGSIQTRYARLSHGLWRGINEEYIKSLYRFNEYHFYTSEEGRFKARIVDVKPTGELILETEEGVQKTFAFKEITFEI